MATYVIGHKNPDTDTIAAAIAFAELAGKAYGGEFVAAAQGACPPESDFVLKKFGVKAPELLTEAAGKKLALVDTTDKAQLPADIDKADVLYVVDHHKLGDVTTSNPLEMWVWPVGCSCTVVKAMYDYFGVAIPKPMAGIMLCAILSDTVMFKSPTCTDKDKKAVEALAKIAGVSDVMALGMEMFKVKSAVEGTPMRELVFRDYKDFNMGGKKVGIGQLEVVDLGILAPYEEALYAEIQKVKGEEGGRHSVFLLLTDIMKEGSKMLFVSDDPSVIQKAFGVKPEGKSVWLDKVMSRKKQVVPPFEKAFA